MANEFKSKFKHRLLFAFTITVFVYAVWYAIQLPIYPDEVAYKIFLERFFINGGVKQSVTPYCMSGFLVRPPWILMPAAAVWSGLRWLDAGWISYRILPILALLSIIYMLWKNASLSKRAFLWPTILLISVSPVIYGLVILRPEVFLIAGGLALFIGARYLWGANSTCSRAAITIALALCFSLMAYMHPKALYLTPLVALGLVFGGFSEKRKWVRATYILISLAIVLWIVLASLDLHKKQFIQCPEVPDIESAMKRQSVNILSAFSDFPKFLTDIRKATSVELAWKTLNQLTFKTTYDSNYLPDIPTIGLTEGFANILNVAVIAIALAVVLSGSWALRKKIPLRENILTFALMLGYLVPFFLNLTRHWYEISFFIGALMVMLGVYSPYFYNTPGPRRIEAVRIKHAWVSLVILAAVLTLYLQRVHFTNKFFLGFDGPGISVLTDRVEINRSITTLLAEKHIDDHESLVIDDMTYESLKFRPMVIPYTYLTVGGTNPEATKRALTNLGVRRGIIRCDRFNAGNSEFDWKVIAQTAVLKYGDAICLISRGN